MTRSIRNARLALRLWVPPDKGPLIVERNGVLRPAPGVMINAAHPGVSRPRARATEKGATDAARSGASSNTTADAAFSSGFATQTGRPRVSEFLRRRWPWQATIGGSA